VRNVESQTLTKLWWRIVPLLALVLLLNYLDKVNIGFASLQMNQALQLSNTVFGFAAGLFAAGYAVAAIPSALLLPRMGARRWMSALMVVWGLCSAATALVATRSELLVARIALGVAEAGFTPGVLLYMTYWFPSEYRGRVLGSFLLILPLSIVVGGPISAALLSWDGLLGLAGWKWLFLLEGLPTVLLASLVWLLLADGPREAHWLADSEKNWLTEQLDADARRVTAAPGHIAGWRALLSPKLAMLALVYLSITTSGTGAIIFLPLVIRSMGFSIAHTGIVAALPALLATFALPLWGVWTDRSRTRETVVAATCFSLALGLLGTAALLPSPWALVPLTIAFIGFFGSTVPFWTLPPTFLTGAVAAAGIATINIAGNLGNFSGPTLLGWLSDSMHSYGAGLAAVAIPAAAAGVFLSYAGMNFSNQSTARVA